MKKTLIELNKACFVYNQGLPTECAALTDVDFKINSGDIISLIGHTGSGKSTLIQLLNGQRRPSSGTVSWPGLDIGNAKKPDMKKLCTQVGMVFQYPEDQVFEETVYEDIAFGPEQLGKKPEEIERQVLKVAELMKITRETLNKSPFELSGGNLRKIAIAGVLVMEPKVLVLDEPMAGLDPTSCENFAHLMNDLKSNLDISIIMVSHNLEYAAELSDYIYCMENGRIAMAGTPREIFSNAEKLIEMQTGTVPSAVCAHKLMKHGFKFQDIPITLDELVRGIVLNYAK